MKFILKTVCLIILISFSVLSKNADMSKFIILSTSVYNTKPEKIGRAEFFKKEIRFKGKKAYSYYVDYTHNNIRNKYEAIVDNNYQTLFTRYQDFNKKRISAIKVAPNIVVHEILNNNYLTRRRLNPPIDAFPSIALYWILPLKFKKLNSQILTYNALHEDRAGTYDMLGRGRVQYQGLKKMTISDQSKKVHVFANSFSGTKSVLFYDTNWKLYAITFHKPGTRIIFVREK